MKKYSLLFAILLVSISLFAQKETFIREYVYRAGFNDSEATAREEALKQIKVELLEEIGVNVFSFTNLLNREDDGGVAESYVRTIQSNSMGVIETRILDSRWDGNRYWLRAELQADVSQIRNDLEEARKKWQAEEMERIRAERAVTRPEQRISPNATLVADGRNVYMGGRKLHKNEVRSIMAFDTKALSLYNDGLSGYATGNTLFIIGGVQLTAGIGCFLLAPDNESDLYLAGVIVTTLSPMWLIGFAYRGPGKKSIANAVNTFNGNRHTTSKNELGIGLTGNGICLVYKF